MAKKFLFFCFFCSFFLSACSVSGVNKDSVSDDHDEFFSERKRRGFSVLCEGSVKRADSIKGFKTEDLIIKNGMISELRSAKKITGRQDHLLEVLRKLFYASLAEREDRYNNIFHGVGLNLENELIFACGRKDFILSIFLDREADVLLSFDENNKGIAMSSRKCIEVTDKCLFSGSQARDFFMRIREVNHVCFKSVFFLKRRKKVIDCENLKNKKISLRFFYDGFGENVSRVIIYI